MTQYEGVWTDVTIMIPHCLGCVDNTTVDFTIFVAIGTPPEHGLHGVLSVCITPTTGDFDHVSLMGKIEKKLNCDTVYIILSFPRKDGVYTGLINFSSAWED